MILGAEQYNRADSSRSGPGRPSAWRGAVTLATAVAALTLISAPAWAAPTAPSPDYGLSTGGAVVTIDAPAAVEYVQIDAGVPFSVALTTSGTAYTWGDNWFGQLGNGTLGGWSAEPVPVVMPHGVTFTQVAAGANHVLALGSDGNVYAWGDNTTGQLGAGGTAPAASATPLLVVLPSDVTVNAVAAGGYHSFALAADGRVFAWDNNSHGQLGLGMSGGSVHTPETVDIPAGVTFTSLSVGHYHSLAIDEDGYAHAWGRSNYGQLGLGDNTDHASPIAVGGPLATSRVTQLVAGQWHSMAITEDGSALAWGDNLHGQLGDGSTSTSSVAVGVTPPSPGVQFTSLRASGSFSLGTGSDGVTYAWGQNSYGQLGTGTSGAGSFTPAAVLVGAGAAPLELMDAAADHAFARGTDGVVYGWGANLSGQLGIGTTSSAATPTPVLLPELEVTDVQFGGASAALISDNGDGTLQVTAPAHEVGPVDITVHWTLAGVAQSPITYVGGFTFTAEPTVTISPATQQVSDGDEAVFTAVVVGYPTPELTWQISTDAGSTWAPVTTGLSSDASILTVQAHHSADGSLYRVVATNLMGSSTSEVAELRVVTASSTSEPSDGSSLPRTGLSEQILLPTVGFGVTLLLLGLVIILGSQRRRTTQG